MRRSCWRAICALVRETGARYHAAHLSTAGSVELIRQAKAEGLPVTAEVTPHHLLLTDEWVAGERGGPLAEALRELGLLVPMGVRYDTNAKVNPPLRGKEDCTALLAGLLDGTIDAIATDHAPHTAVDKDCEFAEAAFGISGFETALAALLALVHTDRLPLPTLIGALTERPSRAWKSGRGDAESRRAGRPCRLRSRRGVDGGPGALRLEGAQHAAGRADAARACADDAAGRRGGLRRERGGQGMSAETNPRRRLLWRDAPRRDFNRQPG